MCMHMCVFFVCVGRSLGQHHGPFVLSGCWDEYIIWICTICLSSPPLASIWWLSLLALASTLLRHSSTVCGDELEGCFMAPLRIEYVVVFVTREET